MTALKRKLLKNDECVPVLSLKNTRHKKRTFLQLYISVISTAGNYRNSIGRESWEMGQKLRSRCYIIIGKYCLCLLQGVYTLLNMLGSWQCNCRVVEIRFILLWSSFATFWLRWFGNLLWLKYKYLEIQNSSSIVLQSDNTMEKSILRKAMNL